VPAVIGAFLAFALANGQPARYAASASFRIQDPSVANNAAAGILLSPQTLTPDEQVTELLQTFIRPALLAETSRRLGGSVSPQAVMHAISVGPQGINGVVAVSAHGASAQLVARVANAVVDSEVVLQDRSVRAVYAQAADAETAQLRAGRAAGLDPITAAQEQQNILGLRALASSSSPVQPVSAATPPAAPTTPRPGRDAVIAALLGLLLGGLILIGRDQINAFTAAGRVGGSAPDPRVVGRIPNPVRGGVVTPNDPGADAAREAFRVVRTNLDFLRPQSPIRSVAVCGLFREAAATTVAASLALACAAAGRRTLLVDGDLHGSSLGERLGVRPGPGLAEVLLRRSTVERVTTGLTWTSTMPSAHDAPSLWFVPAGDARREAIKGFAGDRLASLLRDWQDSYDLVILDTSPVLATAESIAACAVTDAVLLCLRVGLDRLADVARVERSVERLGGGPVGHVLTGTGPD
jgi:Mrp family chromosome partitioning ATPase/capsular polysaccharide biosynthesis protein